MGFKPPFFNEIARNKKRKFKLPALYTFVGFEDLRDHVRNYRAKMESHGA